VYYPALLLRGKMGEAAIAVIPAAEGIAALFFASESMTWKVGISVWERLLLVSIGMLMLYQSYIGYPAVLAFMVIVFCQVVLSRKALSTGATRTREYDFKKVRACPR
jgi:TRAP-type uncharacterized transport system fused permease subunit